MDGTPTATLRFLRPPPWAAALCLAAVLRILFFCAVFPFFNNVDEHAHFDLIWKNAQGLRPAEGSEAFHPETRRAMVLFGSPEYLTRPEQFRDGRYPPPPSVWTAPSRLPVCLLRAAFIPQDVFYSLNSDVLSPVLGTAVLLLLVRCTTSDRSPWYLYAALGLSLALALLVKTANLPLLAMAAAAPLMAAWQKGRVRPGRETAPKLIVFLACLAIPVGVWVAGNLAVTGDWSGSAPKIARLGWTAKPLADLYPHPIFTLSGLGYFLHELFASFWRGELVWGLDRIALPWLDLFYSASTVLLLAIAAFFTLAGWIRYRCGGALLLGLIGTVAAVGFMALLSVRFDFHDCWYPSREKPFFVSGRLLLCAFTPILMGYAYGLERLLGLFKLERWVLPLTAIITASITLAELIINRQAYSSPYNFFHISLGTI